MNLTRPTFDSTAEYGRRFTDADFWRPYVADICARHGLGEPRRIRAGLPGTNPVFVVDELYAVKLYTDLFGGAISYPVECAVYRRVARVADIPAPAFIAAGDLFDAAGGWPWPYIITRAIPGLSLGESRVGAADMAELARWAGAVTRRIHDLPLDAAGPLARDWRPFAEFLARQRAGLTARHAAWGVLPPPLLAQIEAFVPSVEQLIDRATAPVLVHCDLNRDHILGAADAGRWLPAGIIDFGDARVGDPLFEAGALILGLFDGNARLMHDFLDAYGMARDFSADIACRALAFTLLHEFNVLDGLLERVPAAATVATLDELAHLLFGE